MRNGVPWIDMHVPVFVETPLRARCVMFSIKTNFDRQHGLRVAQNARARAEKTRGGDPGAERVCTQVFATLRMP